MPPRSSSKWKTPGRILGVAADATPQSIANVSSHEPESALSAAASQLRIARLEAIARANVAYGGTSNGGGIHTLDDVKEADRSVDVISATFSRRPDNYYDEDYIPPHRRDHSTQSNLPNSTSDNSNFQGQGHTLAPLPSVPVIDRTDWDDDAMYTDDFLSDNKEFGDKDSGDEFITKVKKKKKGPKAPGKKTQPQSSPSKAEAEDVNTETANKVSAKNKKRKSEDVDSDSDDAYSTTKKNKRYRIVQTGY